MARKARTVTIYIAGPMNGHPERNHPLFHSVAEQLRAAGHTVISPAELSELDGPTPWAQCLRRDLTELLKCSTIMLLSGWEDSRGAQLEHHVAVTLGMTVVYPHEIETYL